MPGLVGGFGNYHYFLKIMTLFKSNYKINLSNLNINITKKSKIRRDDSVLKIDKGIININKLQLGPYLAGLIEGDGTISVHDENKTEKKYSPIIIIVFKICDLPLANFLKDLINCGNIYIKQERGYILWQIQDLVGVFTVISIINDYMRTPKIEAKDRVID
jgi:LAGLIDADG endonuclease